METKNISTLISAGVVAATLGVVAQPADAFVITNTSASWDNVTLNSGAVIGSNGAAASTDNMVEFLDVEDVSQVRWGAAVYGTEVTTERAATRRERRAGKARWGNYTTASGRNRRGYYVRQTETVSTYQNKSGLGYQGVSNLNLDVGEVFNLGTLTHFNQTIWSNNFIGEKAEFSLDLDFGESEIGSQQFDFSFSIDETLNSQEVCPYQTDAGKGCSDKITWDFALNEQNTFQYQDRQYSLELVGFGPDIASGEIVNDFISQESGDNSASLFARLVQVDATKDIPEPSFLLGLAGLGFYFARSRKKKMEELVV